MSARHDPAAPGPRGFRWSLAGVERKFDGELETARLALARLQQRSDALQRAELLRSAERAQHEAHALESARRDVLAGVRAMRYLAGLEVQCAAAAAVRAEVAQRVDAARAACTEHQRRLESVQALRLAAQREHAQAQHRRAWREADTDWLAMTQWRRSREDT